MPPQLGSLVKTLDAEALKRANSAPKAAKAEKTDKKKGDAEEKEPIPDGKMFETMEKEASKFSAYSLDKINFGMVKTSWGMLQDNGLLMLGMLPYMWDMSLGLAEKMGYIAAESEITVSLIFVGLQFLLDTMIGIPWSLYSTFVLEEKHGFNKQDLKLFVTDLLTSMALTVVIGGPVMAALLKLIVWGGEYFYIYVWAFLLCFSILFLTIFPVYIQPLFNKYEALPEGELKDAIFALAGKLKFPLTALYQVDGSKRSSHSNAYLYGFFNNKRIVLFDTLIKQMTVPELEAVLGHEVGTGARWLPRSWHPFPFNLIINPLLPSPLFRVHSDRSLGTRTRCSDVCYSTDVLLRPVCGVWVLHERAAALSELRLQPSHQAHHGGARALSLNHMGACRQDPVVHDHPQCAVQRVSGRPLLCGEGLRTSPQGKVLMRPLDIVKGRQRSHMPGVKNNV